MSSEGVAFTGDGDKLVDLFKLSKDEFLASYSYLTEMDYDATVAAITSFVNKQEY